MIGGQSSDVVDQDYIKIEISPYFSTNKLDNYKMYRQLKCVLFLPMANTLLPPPPLCQSNPSYFKSQCSSYSCAFTSICSASPFLKPVISSQINSHISITHLIILMTDQQFLKEVGGWQNRIAGGGICKQATQLVGQQTLRKHLRILQ